MTGAHLFIPLRSLSGGNFSNNHVPRLLGSESLRIPTQHRCPAAATWRVYEGLGQLFHGGVHGFLGQECQAVRAGDQLLQTHCTREARAGPWQHRTERDPLTGGPLAASATAALALLLSCAKPTVPARGGVFLDVACGTQGL